MKITRTAKEYINKQELKSAALRGCSICPHCGEDRNHLYYIKRGITKKGIVETSRNWYGRKNPEGISLFGHNSNWQVDCFSCLNCGTEWESDPYER